MVIFLSTLRVKPAYFFQVGSKFKRCLSDPSLSRGDLKENIIFHLMLHNGIFLNLQEPKAPSKGKTNLKN